MSALRDQILDEAVAALNSGPKPPSIPEAQRARTAALDLEMLDAIIVYPVREKVENVGGKRGPIVAREFEFVVECWATETDAASADSVATAYTAWVIAQLNDNTLGGIVNGLRDAETNYAMDRAQKAFCLAAVTMLAEYQTRSNSLAERT